jgi:hypothetical protein
MALKLRRAEEGFIPQSTRAVSFKRVLGDRALVGRRSHCRCEYFKRRSGAIAAEFKTVAPRL